MDKLDEKWLKLIDIIKSYGKTAVAFSAGVDSTLLLWAAHEASPEVLAITGRLISFPEKEVEEAVSFCESNSIRHIFADIDQMSIEGFSDNPVDRCYICKKKLFLEFREKAAGQGYNVIAEGSNLDDLNDYRPGLRVLEELGIKSPLREAGLTKEEIRELSKRLGLPTWNKPSLACLATRFPHGEKLTDEKIKMVAEAEKYLTDMGFGQVRVRYHKDLARIEVDKSSFGKITEPSVMADISSRFHSFGFKYVTLDLDGYISGSMNPY